MHQTAPDMDRTAIWPRRRLTSSALLLPVLIAISLVSAGTALATKHLEGTLNAVTSEETPPSSGTERNQQEPAAKPRDCAECPPMNVHGPIIYSDTISAAQWEPCVRDGACQPADVEKARSVQERSAYAAWLSNKTGKEYWVVSNRQFCSKTSVCGTSPLFGFSSWTTLQPPFNQVADPPEPKWDDLEWIRQQPLFQNLSEHQLAEMKEMYERSKEHRALQPPGFRVLRYRSSR